MSIDTLAQWTNEHDAGAARARWQQLADRIRQAA